MAHTMVTFTTNEVLSANEILSHQFSLTNLFLTLDFRVKQIPIDLFIPSVLV